MHCQPEEFSLQRSRISMQEYLLLFNEPPMYHVSINSSSIMLDENFNAKVRTPLDSDLLGVRRLLLSTLSNFIRSLFF